LVLETDSVRIALGLDRRSKWESKGQAGLDARRLFRVGPTSDEFAAVAAAMLATLPSVTVDNVERVENGPQHELYSVHRRNVERELAQQGGAGPAARLLFHGTSEAAVQSIVQSDTSGFLPLLAGSTTGALWGDGTYFARDAAYSHDYACRLANGQKQMLLAEVVVGRWAKGQKGLKECPLLPGEAYRRYNSLVNDVANPSIFVVQHTSQAYPAYLITYH
jgi:poly [ADP-ribose] polymerase 7/11/12/13